jgi:hypothetical protein
MIVAQGGCKSSSHATMKDMFCPLYSCSSANGLQQKLYNWNTLNQKVLKKLGMPLSKQHIQDIANGVPGAIERALKLAKGKIATYTEDNMCRCSPHQQQQCSSSISKSGSLRTTLDQSGSCTHWW